MLSTDLTEFIRSVPIALTITDRNKTERKERTEASERTYIYSGRVGYGRAGKAVYGRTRVRYVFVGRGCGEM